MDCIPDITCFNGGVCGEHEVCDCPEFTYGDLCENLLRDQDPNGFDALFYFYIAYTLLLYIIVTIVTIKIIYRNILLHRTRNLVFVAITFLLLEELIRILEFAVDPHNQRGIWSLYGHEITEWLPIVLLHFVMALIVLVWVRILNKAQVLTTSFIRFNMLFYALLSYSIVVFISLSILNIAISLTEPHENHFLMPICLAASGAVLFFLVLGFGIRLIVLVSNKELNQSKITAFLNRVSGYLWLSDGALGTYLLTVVISESLEAEENWLGNLICNILYRTQEIITIVGMLVFFYFKTETSPTISKSKSSSKLVLEESGPRSPITDFVSTSNDKN